VSDSLKISQPNDDATAMPQMIGEEVRMFDISDERRAVLDQFVAKQFDLDSVSGIKLAKRTWQGFSVDARQFVGWQETRKSSVVVARSIPEREFDYLNIAFNTIWANLTPAGKKAAEAEEIAAQQQAARQRFDRLQSMGAAEFLGKSSRSSAKCQLAYIRLATGRQLYEPAPRADISCR
jgi:hypothetical protein